MARPLRTQAPLKPRTQGERIRYARLNCGLTQQQLADAVSAISNMRVSKSLVSKWELDGVNNPNNANMLALQAVTGFDVTWLVTGRGAQRVSMPDRKHSNPLDPDRLAKALAAAAPGLRIDYATTARVASELYEILTDTPEVAPAVLERFAAHLRTKP